MNVGLAAYVWTRDLETALEILRSLVGPVEKEAVPLEQALGRSSDAAALEAMIGEPSGAVR